MARLHDWQLRLAGYLDARRAMPFAWGQNDCCLFAAGAVEAITGADLAAEYRGSYETALQAARVMGEVGGVSAVATKALGEPISPALAAVGDIVLVQIDGRDALGLCNGTSVLGPGADGIVAFGMDIATAAWRVA